MTVIFGKISVFKHKMQKLGKVIKVYYSDMMFSGELGRTL